MAKEIWVPHSYMVQAKPARAREPRWFSFLTETPVSIAEIDAFASPRALVVSRDRPVTAPSSRPLYWGPPKARKSVWRKGNREIGPSGSPDHERVSDVYSGHDGRIYRPLRAPGEYYAPLSVERVVDGNREERFKDHPFLGNKQRKFFHKCRERDDATNAKLRNILVDTEEEAKAQIARKASDLVIFEGGLWQAEQHAFVVSLATDPNGAAAAVSLKFGRPTFWTRASGIHFPADRFPEARDFAESLAASHGGGVPVRIELDPSTVSEVDPDYARIDVPSLTARAFGNAVHAAFMEERAGPLRPFAETVLESLGGERAHRSLHIIGNPFDFADRVMGWADEAVTIPAASTYDAERAKRFARVLADLAEPVLHGRDRGLSAEADATFFREEDLAGFGMFALDEDEAFAGLAP